MPTDSRSLSVGDSLKDLEGSVHFGNPKKILVGGRPALIIGVAEREAEVLYRETRDRNQPSRGYLELVNHSLKDLTIWARDIFDYKKENSDWGDTLRRFGI